jgi:type I restriction enzyme S subunit
MYTGDSINETEKKKKYMGVDGQCYIGTKDVLFDRTIVYNNGVKIPYSELQNFRIATANATLLCVEGGSAGRKIAQLDRDVCFGNKLCCFIPIAIQPQYINYYLQSPSFISVFKSNTTGIIGGVSINTLKAILFAVPPLKEQSRIVGHLIELEPLISEYDKYEQEDRTLDEELPTMLRKSILQYAIQGKLVPQDPTDEPASALLEHIRNERKVSSGSKKSAANADSIIYKNSDDNSYYEKIGNKVTNINDDIPFEIPDSWLWVRLGTLFQHNTGKALNATDRIGTKKKYITTSNLYWDHFNLDFLKEMYFTEDEMEKCSIFPGDLLVCEGGDIGRAAIWSYDIPMCIQNHIHRLRPFVKLEVRFYYYVLYLYKHTGLIGGTGIGIQGLSSNVLHNLLVPLPPIKEQQRIVSKIQIAFESIPNSLIMRK